MKVEYSGIFLYRRLDRLLQLLDNIQGIGSPDIPVEIMGQIKAEINSTDCIDKTIVKEILKKLKLHKYFEYIPYIFNHITGLPNPYFSPFVIDELTKMYKEVKDNYSLFSPPSTYYILYKLLEILGENELMTHIPMLKSQEKICRQDAVWKMMCEYHGWKFIATIGCDVNKQTNK